MGVLAWLGVPAAATILAIAWVHWTARPRGPVETRESLADFERFRSAMSRPPEQATRRSEPSNGRTDSRQPATSGQQRRAS